MADTIPHRDLRAEVDKALNGQLNTLVHTWRREGASWEYTGRLLANALADVGFTNAPAQTTVHRWFANTQETP